MAKGNGAEIELANTRIAELEAQVATLTVVTVNSSKPRAEDESSPRGFLVCIVVIAVGVMIFLWASNSANQKPKCCQYGRRRGNGSYYMCDDDSQCQ
jgi:hypothetical protein